jgi:16S rRNA (guanine527-N7)-methyltransferase
VQIIHGRAEDLGRDSVHREQYDLALARAVAALTVLVEYALPLVRVGGTLVAQKGRQVDQELGRAEPAIEWLGGRLDKVIPVSLPGLDQPRHLLRIVKVAPTPEKYPRRAGMPEKRPLG